MLQNRGKSSDLTPWRSISKQVSKLTPNIVTVANNFTFLERNRKLRKAHYTGNKNCDSVLFPTIIRSFTSIIFNSVLADPHAVQYHLIAKHVRPLLRDTSEAGQSTWHIAGVVFFFSVFCYSLFIAIRMIMSLWSFW